MTDRSNGVLDGFGVLDEEVTDRGLGPAELDVRRRVREIVRHHVAPVAETIDRTGWFPQAGYQALARAGLGGLPIPEEYGGAGQSTLAYAAAMEEIAAACGATSLVYMTQMHAAFPIEQWGTEAQRQRFIPRLCRGEIYGAIAVTEPQGGSDVAALTTTARRVDDGFELSGAKTFITTGDKAGVIIVFATVERAAGRDGVTAFLVEPDAPARTGGATTRGVTAGTPLSKMGMRGSSTVELAFDARLGPDALLGREGGGFAIAMQSVVKTRISAAAQGVGLARGALEAATRWAAGRGLLDPRNTDGQTIQSQLAQLRCEVAAGRTLLHRTAALVDGSSGRLTAEIAEVKLYCTDLAVSVADRAVELMGEDGDRIDLHAERYLRDAKVTQIYDGTNQIQRMLIARDSATRLVAATG